MSLRLVQGLPLIDMAQLETDSISIVDESHCYEAFWPLIITSLSASEMTFHCRMNECTIMPGETHIQELSLSNVLHNLGCAFRYYVANAHSRLSAENRERAKEGALKPKSLSVIIDQAHSGRPKFPYCLPLKVKVWVDLTAVEGNVGVSIVIPITENRIVESTGYSGHLDDLPEPSRAEKVADMVKDHLGSALRNALLGVDSQLHEAMTSTSR